MTKSCDARGGVGTCDSVQFSPYYLIWFLNQPKAQEASTFPNACHVPGTQVSTLHLYFHVILVLGLCRRYASYLQFADQESGSAGRW